jgi:2-polyprenyl-3-methyl-5-hydroxy-6-metoxy-1,4-benzoquinol methylase
MVDAQFVSLCYRAILGRDPENVTVVQEKVTATASPENLVRQFIDSPEFEALRLHKQAGAFFNEPSKRIDVQVTDDQRRALFERLQSQWRALGEAEPFWSVLTHSEYLQANLDPSGLAAFYDTGAAHAALIDHACERTGVTIRRGACLELGCGVGRITKHLAARFEQVIAVDISPGNLRQGQAMAEREGLSNIEFRLLTSLDEIRAMGGVDFFYSVITLQHNPPPIQAMILDAVLKNLNPGGAFLFQTQTYHREYGFDVDRYLASALDNMDMHSLPMHEVMRLLNLNRCMALEVMQDFWTGRFGSHTFFGLSRPA